MRHKVLRLKARYGVATSPLSVGHGDNTGYLVREMRTDKGRS